MDAGVLFDLDGVLLDSAALHERAWVEMAAELGLPLPEGFFAATFGLANREILPRLVGRPLEPDEAARLSERKEALYRREARGRIALYPGAREALLALRAAALPTALATSTPRSNLAFLASELGLDRLLDALVSADEVARGKPAPDLFLLAAERIARPPARCVVVEDALAGLAAARAAGMLTVAVATTNAAPCLTAAGATQVVAEVSEVTPELVRRLVGARAADRRE